MRGSKPTWLRALPPPSALISVPGRMRGRGGGFLDFFPDPPEDPVDPAVGGGGTEVGVFCDIAAATQLIAAGKSGSVELLGESQPLYKDQVVTCSKTAMESWSPPDTKVKTARNIYWL